ncbi:Translation initiation factor 3 subunit J component [Dipsacomyces acuminosporus]|nr:Translation initiation factor 3 subunit J component [Dipsacomyces acuminosporus]
MSDWEDHEVEDSAVVNVPKKKWDDEEEDSDSSIPENWDESESESESEEESEKNPSAVPASKPKVKKSLAERIAERQAEREAKKAEHQANAGDDDSEVDEEDIVAQKLRQRRLQVESDLQNTEELFAGLTVKDTRINNTLASLNPKTAEEFDEFQKVLIERIQKSQTQRYYMQFLEKFIRELADPLKDVDIRKISSILTTLANEKQRAARDALKGGKKKNKKALVKAPPKEQLDMTDYSRGYDDFDDFM